jgi:plasmid stabilization system protein ParE
MKIEISPAARGRIKEIRRYTKKTWGKQQADKYMHGMEKAILTLPSQRHLWRSVDDETLKDIFFTRYEHHYIFFREFKNNSIGIISVLHDHMNIPSRLKEAGDLSQK